MSVSGDCRIKYRSKVQLGRKGKTKKGLKAQSKRWEQHSKGVAFLWATTSRADLCKALSATT